MQHEGAMQCVRLVRCSCGSWSLPSAQISALRFLSTQAEYNNVRFLVLTTKVINGRTLLESFIDQPARSIRKA